MPHARGLPRRAVLRLGPGGAAIACAALVSGLVNLLYLSGSFFMLEVYDRVLPSRSVPTLVALTALVMALYLVQGCLETVRARILTRIGGLVDDALGARVFGIVLEAPIRALPAGDGLQPLRDLDGIRAFLGGSGPSALFDLPWLPVYVAICFLFHPLIGVAALGGAALLLTLTLVADRLTARLSAAATEHGLRRASLAETGRRNAEALYAMGMTGRFAARWLAASGDYVASQERASDVTSGLAAASKILRMALQSGVLALGAWLVIGNQASSGVIIASSILVSRALAPAELAIANWKGFVAARQSWARLGALLALAPEAEERHTLARPERALSVEAVSLGPPGADRTTVETVTFALLAGQALAIVGPSGGGKSTLARALVGIWPARAGHVRLDGAAIDQWSRASLGPAIGYLPQEPELFPGTIADNIARFEPDDGTGAVVLAAMAAGAHDLIIRLPEGYDTVIGTGGAGLSAGQRQRIGLARALYRDPFLVVLDEPNAHLDSDGEAALTQAILGVRRRGGICIVVAHRPNALSAVDLVLVMGRGRMQAFGPREVVLKTVLQPAPATEPRPPSQPDRRVATARFGRAS